MPPRKSNTRKTTRHRSNGTVTLSKQELEMVRKSWGYVSQHKQTLNFLKQLAEQAASQHQALMKQVQETHNLPAQFNINLETGQVTVDGR